MTQFKWRTRDGLTHAALEFPALGHASDFYTLCIPFHMRWHFEGEVAFGDASLTCVMCAVLR